MSLPAPVRWSPVEWELAAETVVLDGAVVATAFARTGRWRRRQFYGKPGGGLTDHRPLSARTPCEWREGTPR